MRVLKLSLLSALLLACPPANDRKDAGPDPVPPDEGTCAIEELKGLRSIAITPPDQVVTVAAGEVRPLAFVASGTFRDGSVREITDKVAWNIHRDDDTPPGTIATNGVYNPNVAAGGVVKIGAEACGVSAGTTATYLFEANVGEFSEAVRLRFSGPLETIDVPRLPSLVYPSDQTRFPRNLYKVLFQWVRAGHDTFRITFAGKYSKTVVYTSGVHPHCVKATPPAGCWEADPVTWEAIAGSNAGEIVKVNVDGVTFGDPKVYRSPTIELAFSKRDVKGAIFYWSTDSAGIRRANLNNSLPEPYVVAKPQPTTLANGTKVACTGCHTISRSGARMLSGTFTNGASGMFLFELTPEAPPLLKLTREMSDIPRSFGTFSPDDKTMIVTSSQGMDEWNDRGEKVAKLPVESATHPDWSPDGRRLAFVDKSGDSPIEGNLQLMEYRGPGVWVGRRTLVPSDGMTNLFPSFSPNSQYVAYARGIGGHNDLTMQLWIARADGLQVPIELVAANRVVNNATTDGQFENNIPTWAPSGDLDWIAFNSLRPYGVVHPSGGTQQIWVTAIDWSKAMSGQDPSFPAFRLGFQDVQENNHRAFWTENPNAMGDAGVYEPPDGGKDDGGVCLPFNTACDQLGGPTCCLGTVCDYVADGGTACKKQGG